MKEKMTDKEIEDVMHLTFNRLEIPYNGEDGNYKQAAQVEIIHAILYTVVMYAMILDKATILETARAALDAAELMGQVAGDKR